MVPVNKTEVLKETMSKAYWHKKWVETYIDDSRLVYDLAFDRIKISVWSFEKNNILDAGCGNGVNTIRLVKRNFKVTSVDFSEEALNLCKSNLLENNIREIVNIEKGDLLNLNFKENTFNSVLCWGVLMHIQEIEKALNELCRVLKPGGYLIICEVSQYTPESLIAWVIKKILPQKNDEIVKSKFGVEYWSDTQVGRMLVRKSNIPSYIKYLESKGFKKVEHIPGQFTQLYTRINNRIIKKILLTFNLLWFQYVKFPNLSREQILIFKKCK